MFEIGWSEILVIAVVAIVVIGPKDLPRAMRFVGQWVGKVKRMGREFQNQFNEALREAELADVQKDIKDIMATDPFADVKQEMAKVETGLNTDLAKTSGAVAFPFGPAPSVAGTAGVPAVTAAVEPVPPVELVPPVEPVLPVEPVPPVEPVKAAP